VFVAEKSKALVENVRANPTVVRLRKMVNGASGATENGEFRERKLYVALIISRYSPV
jgi:hypothetical protein